MKDFMGNELFNRTKKNGMMYLLEHRKRKLYI